MVRIKNLRTNSTRGCDQATTDAPAAARNLRYRAPAKDWGKGGQPGMAVPPATERLHSWLAHRERGAFFRETGVANYN